MKDVTLASKWYAHDQFKPKNQIKQVKGHASEKAIASKLHQTAKRYPEVDTIKWSKDYLEKYERGKLFLPNRVIQRLPHGMRRFHDWYLRVLLMSIDLVQACFPPAHLEAEPEKLSLTSMTYRHAFTLEQWK